MIIIPSIDLSNGQCVRLLQGNFNRVAYYSDEPEQVAAQFDQQGATALHVVDLDGARTGKLCQFTFIQAIRNNFSGNMQVGGGIRDQTDIEQLLALGVDQVVLGSQAVLNIQLTQQWLEKYGRDRIILALDVKFNEGVPHLVINGWQGQTAWSLWDVLQSYPEDLTILCTDVKQDGMQQGPNISLYQAIREHCPRLRVQASGGITTYEQLAQLKQIPVQGAIIGKAIYEKSLDLQEMLTWNQ